MTGIPAFATPAEFFGTPRTNRDAVFVVAGAYSDWTPLEERRGLFAEETDPRCPWQFGNFRVA